MAWLGHGGAVDYLTLSDLSGKPELNAEQLHNYLFEQEGMRQVVRKLCDVSGDDLVGLGYSAEGTAPWRAVREGLLLKKLIRVSSTRLRHERVRLAVPAITLWRELDAHRPDDEWYRLVPSRSIVYQIWGHNFYDGTNASTAGTYQADVLAAIQSSSNTSDFRF